MTGIETTAGRGGHAHALLSNVGIGVLSLLAANAGLLFFYFAFDLTLYQVVLVYWWECLWIGLYSALRLIVASIIGTPYENRFVHVSVGSRVLISIILIVAVSSVFFSLLGGLGLIIFSATEHFTLTSKADESIRQIGFIVGVSILFLIGHGLSFVINFLIGGEYKYARVGTLMALPFKHCLTLLAMIAFAYFFAIMIPALATTAGFAALVILLKVSWDLWSHKRERRSIAGAAPSVQEA